MEYKNLRCYNLEIQQVDRFFIGSSYRLREGFAKIPWEREK